MRAREVRSVPIVLAVAAALLTAAGASAEDPASLRNQADRLEARNAELADRERSAVLELYALGSRLSRADERVSALRRRAAEVEAARAAAERRLDFMRATLDEAQRRLAERLRALYVEGNPDPLAVLLGAGSLDEALTALDSLDRFARHDKEIVADVQAAQRKVKEAIGDLAREQDELAALTAEAEAARNAVAAARAGRASYLAWLREQRRLNTAEMAALTGAAEAAEEAANELAPPSAPETTSSAESSPSPAPAAGGRKLTVQATGYSLRGITATGIPTGWGVVAVDPSVIPLGTKMFVPGYGEGVAADTGGAVKGNVIDLWFPTAEQALAWGRRTVTITLH
jgi:3D (Asp-Asp-Asp) domain-containing protein